MSMDSYEFSAYSALFNTVNNSIFIRDGVANRVTSIFPNKFEQKLTVRNEFRLRNILFEEIMNKYNNRIRNHHLNFKQLSYSDKKNLDLVQFITTDIGRQRDSGLYMAYPRTFRCTKCNDYKVLYKDDWRKFDVNTCQNGDCDGHYVQVSILGFCETCGNVETLSKSCPEHHYEALTLIQDDKEAVSSWRLKCRKCGWESDFKAYPCNHRNKYVFGEEPICNDKSTDFNLINVQRGGLFQSCVKTTVDVPSNNDNSRFIDEIIIGNYLHLFDEFNFREGREISMMEKLLKNLETYPTEEDRQDAIDMGVSEKLFEKAEKLENKLKFIRENFKEYAISDIVDYLILKEFITFGNNKSFNEYYKEFNNDITEESYESFKNTFGIYDIIHIPDIQLISSSYGSISGINKFYDTEFVPHFEPHWIKDMDNPHLRERFRVYTYPFETEGIMFDLDNIKLANWLIDNFHPEKNHFDSLKDAKGYLFNLDEDNNPEYDALYSLIHSFSHVLIKRSSLYTGLEMGSCGELLFPKSGAFMIYSTSNINIGGFSFVFENSLMDWFDNVKLDIDECILDPSCINETGACFSCMHLPEYVCCRFNQFLDRDVFIGKHRFRKGFWEI